MTTEAAVEQKARKARRLSGVDLFLWAVRIAAVILVVVGAVSSISSGRLSGQLWRNLMVFGVAQGAVYALIALGYTMVYGVLRFINFAHGEVFMSGAMIGYFVADGLERSGMWDSSPVASLVVVMVASMGTSTIIAVTLEKVAYRPLRGAPRLIPLITSIGASFFLQYAFRGLFGEDVKTFPQVPILGGPPITVAGFRIINKQLVVIIIAAVAMVALYLFVEKTKLGRSIRAVSEDQEIARLMGIDVDRTISLVFAIGGAMAGLAGALYLLVFGNIFFLAGFIPGIKAFAAAVLGGIGNIVGAALGGITLGAVESIGPSLVLAGLGVISANQLKDMIGFLVLVLVLIFRPTGILGEKLAEDRA